jgi:hypothetical protein
MNGPGVLIVQPLKLATPAVVVAEQAKKVRARPPSLKIPPPDAASQ